MRVSRRLASARQCTAATAAVAAFLAGMAASAAPAQQAPESPPAAWRVECSGDGKTLECRAVQQVFHRETRQLVLSVAVRPAADGKSGAMLMTLPLGLNLTEPVLVKVDNGAPERQAIQTCTRGARHCGGCGHGVRFVRRRRAGRSVRCTACAAERPARPRARAFSSPPPCRWHSQGVPPFPCPASRRRREPRKPPSSSAKFASSARRSTPPRNWPSSTPISSARK
jgi:invasion protein IalB